MCFEILGFDIFLDDQLKPWILEVNHAPSFSTDSPLDFKVKTLTITPWRLDNQSGGKQKKYKIFIVSNQNFSADEVIL